MGSERARAHAKHSYFCICGRIVYGNGGKANHFFKGGIPDQGKRDGHREIGYETWTRETDAGREHARTIEARARKIEAKA